MLEAANQPVSRVRGLVSARTRSGRVWAKFADSLDSGPVVLNTDEARVAAFFLDVVEANVPVQLATTPGIPGAAAADASAEGELAGIGGWWIAPGDRLCPGNIYYFSIAIHLGDLPAWFVKPLGAEKRDLQPLTALEALAQLVLLEARCSSLRCLGQAISDGWPSGRRVIIWVLLERVLRACLSKNRLRPCCSRQGYFARSRGWTSVYRGGQKRMGGVLVKRLQC